MDLETSNNDTEKAVSSGIKIEETTDSCSFNENKEDEDSSERSQRVPNKEGPISRHSNAILALTAIGSLITTVVLALFAYFSLTEAKKKRDLAFRQFILANAPSVRVYSIDGFNFADQHASMYWTLVNTGGTVQDVECKSILLCCGAELLGPDLPKMVIRTVNNPRLVKHESLKIQIFVDDLKTLGWLKEQQKDENKLFLYIRVEYTIPSELSLTGRPERDYSFRLVCWDPTSNRFENLRVDKFEQPKPGENILRLIEDRGYLKIVSFG